MKQCIDNEVESKKKPMYIEIMLQPAAELKINNKDHVMLLKTIGNFNDDAGGIASIMETEVKMLMAMNKVKSKG